MKKIIRVLLLILVLAFGLVSLVATSPERPRTSPIKIITRNPTNPKRGYFANQSILDPSYACKNDEISIEWNLYGAKTVLLTANPLKNIEPELKQELLSKDGSINLTVKDEVTLTIETQNTSSTRKLKQTIKMIPNELCTKFPIIPIAAYEGKLEQKKPFASSIDKIVKIYMNPFAKDDELKLGIFSTEQNPNEQPYYIRQAEATLDCIANVANATIICKQQNPDYYNRIKDLEMNIKLTKDGFSGTYKGLAKHSLGSWSAISGTFIFIQK